MSRFIIDGHCDTLTKVLDYNYDLKEHNHITTDNHITIDGLISGNVGMQFFAAWIGDKYKYGPCLQRGLLLIDKFYDMLYRNNILQCILHFKDIKTAWCNNKIAALLTVEGGEILEGNIANLRILYKLGVRLMTLTWNERNEIADGIMERSSMGGLSSFGQKVVAEMNNLGMIIDVSHISEKGFWDVIELSNQPIIASHSNARKVFNHPRNLSDDQIIALANKNGIIGVNFYPNFLAEADTNVYNIVRHIEYIAQLVGMDYIGFGSDFDGIEKLPHGIIGPESYYAIINELLKLNYKEEELEKICNKNYLRVLENVLE